MRISDWSSDVCSSDLRVVLRHLVPAVPALATADDTSVIAELLPVNLEAAFAGGTRNDHGRLPPSGKLRGILIWRRYRQSKMPAGPFTGLTGLCHFRIQLPGKGKLRLGPLRGGRAALWKRAGNPEASIPGAQTRLLPFPGRPQRCRQVVPAADDVPRAASQDRKSVV